MKKIFLFLLGASLLLSCEIKKKLVETSINKMNLQKLDSVISENKQLKESQEVFKDSVSKMHKVVHQKEVEITKASEFETIIELPYEDCFKELNQTLGNEHHQLEIKSVNNKLHIKSKQLKDLISTKDSLVKSNSIYQNKYRSLKVKLTKENKQLQVVVNRQKEIIQEYKLENKTRTKWSKWTYIFLLSTIVLAVVLVMVIKKKLFFWI